MAKNNVTKLALKMAGIYILVQLILYIPSIVMSIRMLQGATGSITDNQIASITLLGSFALLLIIGLLLTFLSRPKFSNTKTVSKDLLTTGIAVGGIIIFALALNDLPQLIAYVAYELTSSNVTTSIGFGQTIESISSLATVLIQFILGLLLFFKARFFAKLVK